MELRPTSRPSDPAPDTPLDAASQLPQPPQGQSAPGRIHHLDDGRLKQSPLHNNSNPPYPRQTPGVSLAEVLNNDLPSSNPATLSLPGIASYLATAPPPPFSGRLRDILIDPSQDQRAGTRKNADGDASAPKQHTPASLPPMAENRNENSMLTLPKLPRLPSKPNRRQMIPPLLQGLHHPPPVPQGSVLFPPITSEGHGFGKGIPDRAGSTRAYETDTYGHDKTGEEPDRQKQTYRRVEPRDHSTSPAKETRKRNKWTDEESKDLLLGAKKHGVGSWKKILTDPDYHFNSRTAVDLKDRFRTLCPEQGSKKPRKHNTQTPGGGQPSSQTPPFGSAHTSEGASPAQTSTVEPQKRTRKPRGDTHRVGAADLAELGIDAPFAKVPRRERNKFTDQDDANLLKGYHKYGAAWHSMRDDVELGFRTRQPTDLRDRFRNKFKEIYSDAGYKLKARDELILKKKQRVAEADNPLALSRVVLSKPFHTRQDLLSGTVLPDQTSNTAPTQDMRNRANLSLSSSNPTLRPHTLRQPPFNSFPGPLDDFPMLPEDDVDFIRSPVTLSRNILDANPGSTSNTLAPTRASAHDFTTMPGDVSSFNNWPSGLGSDDTHIDPRSLKLYSSAPVTNATATPSAQSYLGSFNLSNHGSNSFWAGSQSMKTNLISNLNNNAPTSTSAATSILTSSSAPPLTQSTSSTPSYHHHQHQHQHQNSTHHYQHNHNTNHAEHTQPPNLPNLIFLSTNARNTSHILPPPSEILSGMDPSHHSRSVERAAEMYSTHPPFDDGPPGGMSAGNMSGVMPQQQSGMDGMQQFGASGSVVADTTLTLAPLGPSGVFGFSGRNRERERDKDRERYRDRDRGGEW